MLGTDAAEKLARRLWEETLRPLAETRRDPWLRFLAHAALDSVARARRGLDAPLVFVTPLRPFRLGEVGVAVRFFALLFFNVAIFVSLCNFVSKRSS